MKRLNRQEMLSILATLRKANRLSATSGISAQQLVGILTRCQESAITLGEALERYGEVGEQVIHMRCGAVDKCQDKWYRCGYFFECVGKNETVTRAMKLWKRMTGGMCWISWRRSALLRQSLLPIDFL